MKRFIAIILMVCVCVSSLTLGAGAKSVSKDGYDAIIEFNSQKYSKGVKNFSIGSKTGTLNATSVTEREGEECWEISTAAGHEYLYIDFDASLGNSLEDGSTYDIEIDYLDLDKGFLFVWYDDLNYGKQICGEIYGENTKAWKTFKVTLENAGFSGGINGHDFMLSVRGQMNYDDIKSGASAFIKEIRVKRNRKVQPVLAESYIKEPGNIFCHTDEQKIATVTYTNTLSAEAEFEATYHLVDDYGIERWNHSETIKIENKGEAISEVNIDTDYCGLYTLYVDIKNKDFNYRIKEDTITIVKRNEDGSASESMIAAAEAIRGYGFKDEEILDQYEIVKRANFAGVRGGEIDLLAQMGLERLALVYGGFSSRLKNASWTMPETEEDFVKFENSVRKNVVEKMLSNGYHKYELWNEPNVSVFVGSGQTPEHMAKMQKRFYEIVKEMDPEAVITGLTVTMLGSSSADYWFDGVMENDFYKYIDGLALHPYEMRVAPEEANMDLQIKKYKDAVVKAKGEDIVIFNTEYGHTIADGISSKQLADWLVRDTVIFKLSNMGDVNVPYNMIRKGPRDNNREDNFGMTSPCQSDYNIEGKVMIPRAAYVTMAAMAYMITGTDNHNAQWIERTENFHAGTFESRKFNSKVMPLWLKSGAETITLHLGTNRVDLYDGYGNKKTLESDDGIYTFYVTERMQYVVGDIKDYKRIENNRYSFDMGSLNCSNKGIAELNVLDNENTNAKVTINTAFECAEKKHTESGKTNAFAVYFTGEVGDMRHIEVDIEKDGKLVSTASIPVSIVVPATLDVTFEPAEEGNYDKWKGVITIQNNLKTMVEKGFIEFSEPSMFANLGKINLGYIPRGKMVRVEFDCPPIKQKGMYSLGYNAEFESGNTFSEKQLVDFTMATYANNKPIIDGKADADEWPSNTAMVANSQDYVKFTKKSGNEWRGVDDLSANVSMMWDDENLYMFSTVKDDVHRNPAGNILDGWSGDSIQFGLYLIDKDEFLAIGEAGVNFHEFIIARLDNGEVGTYMNKVQTSGQTPRMLENAETAIVRGDGVATYEVKIPWSEIMKDCSILFKPEVGVKIGFSILWNDDDGVGRRGWMEYASGIGNFKDASQFTYLNLIK